MAPVDSGAGPSDDRMSVVAPTRRATSSAYQANDSGFPNESTAFSDQEKVRDSSTPSYNDGSALRARETSTAGVTVQETSTVPEQPERQENGTARARYRSRSRENEKNVRSAEDDTADTWDVKDRAGEPPVESKDADKERPTASKEQSRYVQLMHDLINHIEDRFRKLESRAASDAVQERKIELQRRSTISELNYVKWSEFKNRNVNDEKLYAIDVLVGGARYWYQRRRDEWTRQWKARIDQTASPHESVSCDKLYPTDELPDRIRINSRHLEAILSNVFSGESSIEPQVHLRPFKMLVQYDSEIRDFLSQLERKWACKLQPSSSVSDQQGMGSMSDSQNASQTVNGAESHEKLKDSVDMGAVQEVRNSNDKIEKTVDKEKSEDLLGSLKACMDLRCLVGFMDRHIAPVLQQFQQGTRKTVQFHELWYLFRVGEIIYQPKIAGSAQPGSQNAPRTENQARYQTTFRIIYVDGGRPILSNKNSDEDQPQLKDRVNRFEIYCYYIDFDGKDYIPVGQVVSIHPFEGERPITCLDAYPLRYAEQCAQIREELTARGKKFRSVLEQKHMFYDGQNYVTNPNGSESKGLSAHVEHISSEVIVDFKQAVKSGYPATYSASVCVSWLNTRITLTYFRNEFDEDYPVTVWKDSAQTEVHSTISEDIFEDDSIDYRSGRSQLRTNPFLKAVVEAETIVSDVSSITLQDEDLILLTRRVFAFALRERTFFMLDVHNLRCIKSNADGFRNLELPKGHKEMVRALVKSHSMGRNDRAATESSVDYDVVHGKGRGLIILLHGVPGVGKTSTAECIAAATGKPLFPITCGDLGLTAEDVERSLRRTFHLAQTWDCVLLLDEADVFLAQRTKHDLKRNALVSVFLRTLEYYTGILFLTTNRVGSFDEAFKSRIHISLYYPQLVEVQYLKIWQMNLERTKQIDAERTKTKTIPGLVIDDEEVMGYARVHWNENQDGAGKWNGRQIRNAFQTASALALYAAHVKNVKLLKTNPDAEMVPPYLETKHFQKVARATTQFDQYMEETIGKDDADWAHARGDRTDRFDQTSTYSDLRASTVSNSPGCSHCHSSRSSLSRHHHASSMALAQESPAPSPLARQTEFKRPKSNLALRKNMFQSDCDSDGDSDSYEYLRP